MNGIQRKKLSGRQWNILLDVVVTLLKYKKITIDNAIYIKLFSDWTVSYLTVSDDNVLNTTTNETSFHGGKKGFKEHFEINFQEGYVLK